MLHHPRRFLRPRFRSRAARQAVPHPPRRRGRFLHCNRNRPRFLPAGASGGKS